jgi:tetratricopeptide (TPR) repeat protein
MKRLVWLAWLLSLMACASRAAPIEHAPTGADLLARGLDYAARGDDLAAEQYLSTARAAGVPEERVARELVKVCVGANRLEHALRHAELYTERHPGDRPMRQALASIYFAKGDALAARLELEQLLREWPDSAESHFLLALILRDQFADIPAARRSMESYLALAPQGERAGEARAWIKRSAAYPVQTRRRVR